MPAQCIGEIVKGRLSITADTDLRLCRFFELSDGYWLRAQAAHDIEIAQSELGKTLRMIKPWGKRIAS
jgi:addiction module HigA family antidote